MDTKKRIEAQEEQTEEELRLVQKELDASRVRLEAEHAAYLLRVQAEKDEFVRQQALVSEKLARLSRLRVHRRALVAQGVSLGQQGLEALNAELAEEEAVEDPSEVLARQDAVFDAHAVGAFGVLDWDAIGMPGDDGLDLSWLNDPVLGDVSSGVH